MGALSEAGGSALDCMAMMSAAIGELIAERAGLKAMHEAALTDLTNTRAALTVAEDERDHWRARCIQLEGEAAVRAAG